MRIVVKIGTNVLTKKLIGLNTSVIKQLAKEIGLLRRKGHEVIVVTSGAIGAGCTELKTTKPRDIQTRQALAAIGQSTVMRAYHDALAKEKVKVAQILLTYDDFSNRKRFLNLKASIKRLLELDVVPIINENDPISVDEIDATFGDNDKLSALVASKINADLLLILSDIDGLYDRNPSFKDAKLIRTVTKITKDIEKAAGSSGSAFAVGGMSAKIAAAKISMDSGFNMIICNGKKKGIITKALDAKEGTLFVAKGKLSERDRWIKFSKSKGKILINKKAADVIKKGKSSLLSVGVSSVTGTFSAKDVVDINSLGKGVVDLSSAEIKKIIGKKGKVIIKSENIILL